MGTTRHGESHTYQVKSVDALVEVTDTPGMSEAGEAGEAREVEARALAVRADLLLFVVDHDLIRSEYSPLIELARLGKRSIVVLNKKDRFPDDDLAAILAKLRERLSGIVDPADIVAVAAAPRPLPVRMQRPDGSFETVLEKEEPDIAAVLSRMVEVLRREGKLLRAANLLVRGRILEQEAQEQLATERDRRALEVVDHHQWITAATVFANPIPALDILAGGAVQLEMIADLARVQGLELTAGQVRSLAAQMVQSVLKLGLIEAATSLIAGVFKRTLVGFAAGGAVQAVTMAYLTRVSGKAFIDYFRQGQSWSAGGIDETVLHQFEQTSRSEFLQEFASQFVHRILKKLQTASERWPRSIGPEGGPMKLFPDDNETIVGTARRLRSGETTCVEVLQSCLDRIDEREHEVRAWVNVDRTGALTQAVLLDVELQTGHDRGPLHGIPIGVKDIIDVKGVPTRCGITGWEANSDPSDAAIVTRLLKAGAIILGKTVSTPFAWIDPPVTRNPWNLGRTPGGSSSGSAAAVACGMCLAALGTQTGGSITRPAAFCGVAGMKPTYGCIDDRGIFPLAPTLDHPGFIARSVADLRLIYEVCRRPELPAEQDAPWVRGAVDRPRLWRLLGLFGSLASPEMATAMSSALGCLGDAGAEVLSPDFIGLFGMEGFESHLRDHRVILAAEAAATHRQLGYANPPAYPPRIAELLREGDEVRARRLFAGLRVPKRDTEPAWMSCSKCVDALVTPATLGAAPDSSTTGDPVFNSPWSLLGLPTVSFPIGLSADGLPLAVQLVGRQRIRPASLANRTVV